jgi:hypothetical protein
MNIRSSAVAVCLLAVAAAGCGTVTASSPAPGARTTAPPVHPAAPATTGAPSGCQHPAGGELTLASNGKTYCVRVGERFEVYLRGTVASPWLAPLASSVVLRAVPNGAFSLVAGLTGGSFAAVRPGQAFITSLRPPCAGPITQRNEAQPKYPLPRTYPLHSCTPQRRFIVTIVVLS